MGNTPSQTPFEICVRSALPGSAISVPTDPFYDLNVVKAYNKAYDITPVAVVRPSTTDQVSKVVKCATDNAIKVQARSGGHSYGDYSIGGEDGALVIDMVNFQQFSMDQETGHATIGSGTLLGDVTKRLHDAGGRAMAHGTCPQVGIGGHATIGGLGPVSRLWGSALDHIIEAEVVLANGTVVRTNEVNSPEVLYAVKGAGASFGVVTEFKVITHPEPEEMTKYSYTISLGSHKNMATTFAAWQDFISQPDLTRKLASQLIVFEWGMIIEGTYFGPQSEFEALKFGERFSKDASSISVTLDNWMGTVTNWAETEALQLLGGVSAPFYSKSLAFRNDTLIPGDTIQSLFELFDSPNKGTALWFAIFDLEGGATNDIAMDATAYAHRDALFYIQTYAIGLLGLEDRTKQYLNDINDLIDTSLPNANLGAYPGYVDPFLKDGQQLYWGSNYPRLQQIKKELDPKDIFHNPQSVVPV
ncbi:FAD-binding domain-containing protein [Marasmius fiardii PR-910]|nr:FAD-binding domain-containing protein [Marasmius fiardii PR-910]